MDKRCDGKKDEKQEGEDVGGARIDTCLQGPRF